jgi:hypothetical protein
VYANGGHTSMEIAGILFDTSRVGDPNREKLPALAPAVR